MSAVLTTKELAQSATEPRQIGKITFDELFPGFNADRFVAQCIRNGVSLSQAKAILRGEKW